MDLESILLERSIQASALARESRELDHTVLVGSALESLFERILGAMIPDRYKFGTGKVVGIGGAMSQQVDVICFDALECPRWVEGSMNVFPSLGVYGIVEMKATLDKDELVDSLTKISNFKRLYRNEPTVYKFGNRFITRQHSEPRPFGIVFAYDARTSLKSLQNNLSEFDKTQDADLLADLVVVLGKGLIYRTNDEHSITVGGMLSDTSRAVEALHKTFGLFYQKLSELLVSVSTFPVDPSLYQNVQRRVDGHLISGQVRINNAITKKKESLSDSFLKQIIEWVISKPATTIEETETRIFVDHSLEFFSVGQGPIFIYDPRDIFAKQPFNPITILSGHPPQRSLLSSCLVITVDETQVLVPHVYLTEETVITMER